MSKVLAGLGLAVLIGVIAYVAATGGFAKPQQQVTGIVQNVIDYNQPTGDVVSLITVPPPAPTQDQIMQEQRLTSGINASSIQNSTISGTVGETFGRTDQYTTPYGKDYYQIGTPVIISAKLVKVIPGSCEQDQYGNLVNCDYVEPPKFKYNFSVTCDFRDFCNLADISRWETTDNNGFLMQRVDTSATSFTTGLYKATILANSEVKDTNGRAYEIKADYYFNMVN